MASGARCAPKKWSRSPQSSRAGKIARVATDVEAVSWVLRSFGEARDGPFYALWIELLRGEPEPQPEIGFRIYKSSGSAEYASHTVLYVSAARDNGMSVARSLASPSGRSRPG